ncbi:MAG: hypothetical protein K6C97_07010, partial [Treponema sp.]|nr:hypothetical protein [Treponema sp.]
MKKFIVRSLLVLLSIVFTVSCEIGLGAAVDTEAPELTITSPETDAVIRDTFAIKGSWSDDGTIDNIKVTLNRTDINASPVDCTATISGNDGSGEWSAIVNPQEQTILDGSYEATVTVTDGGGHTVTKTKTFTIDNTAPLVVLQRPGTKIGESSPDAYGQTLNLTGEGYDDNSIKYMDVSFYSDPECNSLIKTVRMTNITLYIDLKVAVFEEGVNNDYAAIYGSSAKDNGTQTRYCKITAYDGAKRYPVEGESTADDELGN